MAVLDKSIYLLTEAEYLSLCAYHGELMGKLNLVLYRQAVDMPWIDLSKFAFNTPLAPWSKDTYVNYIIRRMAQKCATVYPNVKFELTGPNVVVKTYKRWLEEVETHFVNAIEKEDKKKCI